MNSDGVQTLASAFPRTLNKLEGLINYLEKSTGSDHKPSGFEKQGKTNQEKKEIKAKPADKKEIQTEPKEEKQKKAEKKEIKAKPAEKKEIQSEPKEEKQKKEEKKVDEVEKSKEKKKAEQPKQIPEESFQKIEIRVGKIVECWKHPNSDVIYCTKIDIGDEVKEIGAGLQTCVPIEEMKGLVIIMNNLRPRKLGEWTSNGMVLCAGNAEDTKWEILRPDEKSKVGERVTLEGYENIPQGKEKQLDKKVLEKCFPLMKTDSEGFACFNGKKWRTSAGNIKVPSFYNGMIS